MNLIYPHKSGSGAAKAALPPYAMELQVQMAGGSMHLPVSPRSATTAGEKVEGMFQEGLG